MSIDENRAPYQNRVLLTLFLRKRAMRRAIFQKTTNFSLCVKDPFGSVRATRLTQQVVRGCVFTHGCYKGI